MLKIRSDFMLKQVAGEWIVVALAKASVKFKSMIRLNETGKLLWDALTDGADEARLCAIMTENYDVDEAKATADVNAFVASLREIGCLEDAE